MLTNEQFDGWLADLRSGNYKQTKGALHRQGCGGGSYCALGILGEKLPGRIWEDGGVNVWTGERRGLLLSMPDTDPSAEILPFSVLAEELQNPVSEQNDDGATLEEIADYLEARRAEYVQAVQS